MKNYSLTETFFICQDAAGNPLEFPSDNHALVCLAFDFEAQQLVELHLLTNSEDWTSEQRQGLFERLVLLGGVNGGSVPRVLRRGEMDGLAFFTVALEEGEVAADYAQRTGGMPERVVLDLMEGLLEKLHRLQALPRLFRASRLVGAKLIYDPQGTALQRLIQVCTLGLHDLEARQNESEVESRLAAEFGQLLYQMLSGHLSPLRGGPMVESLRLLDRCLLLRQFVRLSFGGGSQPLTFADAASALTSARQFATEAGNSVLGTPPFAVSWIPQIFGNGLLDHRYPVQFELKGGPALQLDDISCRAARDSKSRSSVYLLPLPGKRILPRPQFSAAPEELGQIPLDQADHLLFPQSTWNSDHLSFHVEKSVNSFSLKEFLQQRGSLQAGEIVAILSQVEAAHQQAGRLGLRIPSLRSSVVRCVFKDDCDEAALSERCRMTVSHWPSHLIKVRIHASLCSVTNPWPAGIDPDRAAATKFNDAFAMLGVEMAGGVRSLTRQPHLSHELVKFLLQQAQAAAGKEPVLEPASFLRAVSQRGGVIHAPVPMPPVVPVVPLVPAAAPVIAPQQEASLEKAPEIIGPTEITEVSTPTTRPIFTATAGLAPEPAFEVPVPVAEVEEPAPAAVPEVPVVVVAEVPVVHEAPPQVEVSPVPHAPMPSPTHCEAPQAKVSPEPTPAPTVSEETFVAPPRVPQAEVAAVLPASSPAAIAAHFSNLFKPAEPAEIGSEAVPETEPEKLREPIAPQEVTTQQDSFPSPFRPFVESSAAPDLSIAPFPIENLDVSVPEPEPESTPLVSEIPPEQIMETPQPNIPKSIPPSVTGLVTWRFESTPKPQAAPVPTAAIPPPPPAAPSPPPPPVVPLIAAVPTVPVQESIPLPTNVLPSVPQPAPAAPDPAPVAISNALEDTQLEPSDELPPEEFSAPTLNIDLSRLTTSDSLFSRRPRTITIRNR